MADSADAGAETPRFALRHTVKEIAELWHLSDDAVRNIFEREPGVLVLGGDRKPGMRRKSYTTTAYPRVCCRARSSADVTRKVDMDICLAVGSWHREEESSSGFARQARRESSREETIRQEAIDDRTQGRRRPLEEKVIEPC
jgi:hypothetical protein